MGSLHNLRAYALTYDEWNGTRDAIEKTEELYVSNIILTFRNDALHIYYLAEEVR